MVNKKTSPSRSSYSTYQPSASKEKQPVEHSQIDNREYNPKNYEDGLINNTLDLEPGLNYETNKRRMVSGYHDDEFENGVLASTSTTRSKTENEIDHEKEIASQDELMKEKYKLNRLVMYVYTTLLHMYNILLLQNYPD